jgi:hypothetical protein
VIKNGKVVKNETSKVAKDSAKPSKDKKAKFIIKDGKLVKGDTLDSEIVDSTKATTKGKKTELTMTLTPTTIRKARRGSMDTSQSKVEPAKPAFNIVGGKLVKADAAKTKKKATKGKGAKAKKKTK